MSRDIQRTYMFYRKMDVKAEDALWLAKYLARIGFPPLLLFGFAIKYRKRLN